MSGSTVINPVNQQIPIFNAQIPPEGPKCVNIPITFTNLAASAVVDFTMAYQNTSMSVVQTLWIDNSVGYLPISISISGTGQTINVPALSQGAFPIIAAIRPKITLSCPNVISGFPISVDCLFLNVPLPSVVWEPAGSSGIQTVIVQSGNITTVNGSVTMTQSGSVTSTDALSQTTTLAGSKTTLVQTSTVNGIDYGGTITAGGTSQIVQTSNTNRQLATIQNPPDAASQGIATAENLFIQLGNPANVNGANYACLLPGGSITLGTDVIAQTESINVNAATTGHRFYCRIYL